VPHRERGAHGHWAFEADHHLSNGETKEFDCENLFSAVGINFGNVKQNQQLLLQKLNELVGQGYTIYSQTTGVFSQGDGNFGIFKTHYLLTK
jgi:hypothetical protein